jgi:hypothetical protein
MSDDYSLFPKLNPLPPAENAQDSKRSPGREVRRKKKERKKDRPGNESAPGGEGKDPEDGPDQQPVGKVLDITI